MGGAKGKGKGESRPLDMEDVRSDSDESSGRAAKSPVRKHKGKGAGKAQQREAAVNARDAFFVEKYKNMGPDARMSLEDLEEEFSDIFDEDESDDDASVAGKGDIASARGSANDVNEFGEDFEDGNSDFDEISDRIQDLFSDKTFSTVEELTNFMRERYNWFEIEQYIVSVFQAELLEHSEHLAALVERPGCPAQLKDPNFRRIHIINEADLDFKRIALINFIRRRFAERDPNYDVTSFYDEFMSLKISDHAGWTEQIWGNEELMKPWIAKDALLGEMADFEAAVKSLEESAARVTPSGKQTSIKESMEETVTKQMGELSVDDAPANLGSKVIKEDAPTSNLEISADLLQELQNESARGRKA